MSMDSPFSQWAVSNLSIRPHVQGLFSVCLLAVYSGSCSRTLPCLSVSCVLRLMFKDSARSICDLCTQAHVQGLCSIFVGGLSTQLLIHRICPVFVSGLPSRPYLHELCLVAVSKSSTQPHVHTLPCRSQQVVYLASCLQTALSLSVGWAVYSASHSWTLRQAVYSTTCT